MQDRTLTGRAGRGPQYARSRPDPRVLLSRAAHAMQTTLWIFGVKPTKVACAAKHQFGSRYTTAPRRDHHWKKP